MSGRKKTTIYIPPELDDLIESVGWEKIGIGRNAFLAMSAAMFLVQLASLAHVPRRKTILDKIEKEFQRLLNEAREGLH